MHYADVDNPTAGAPASLRQYLAMFCTNRLLQKY